MQGNKSLHQLAKSDLIAILYKLEGRHVSESIGSVSSSTNKKRVPMALLVHILFRI